MNIVPRFTFCLAALSAALLFAMPAQPLSKHEAEQAGADLFRTRGCTHCHGAKLQGTHKGPALGDKVRKGWKPAQIVDQIVNGGQTMPSFRDSVSDAEVQELVQFLRAKHRPEPSPAAAQTPADEAPPDTPEPTPPPVSNPGQ